jgi:protein phosphatase
LLVCSDGLTGELDVVDIADILSGPGTAQEIAEALVAQALSAGGRDNVTAVVVDVLAVGADVDGELVLSRRPDIEVPDNELTRPRGGRARVTSEMSAKT